MNVIISAGEVTFSIIGDDRARHFLIAGRPIEDLKFARRICLPGDLVLSSSAWEHCAPSQYEYVIKDPNNIKVRVIQLDLSVSIVAHYRRSKIFSKRLNFIFAYFASIEINGD